MADTGLRLKLKQLVKLLKLIGCDREDAHILTRHIGKMFVVDS